ncbi:MAG: ATP-binding protein [Pseudomonadota bacterium]
MISLRRRLLLILLWSFAAAWLLLATMSYFNARHEIEELFDAQLAQSARVLLGLTLHEIEEENEPDIANIDIVGVPWGHKYEEKIAFQIWSGDKLLLRSPNAPAVPMASAAGYRDESIEGKPWRVFLLHDQSHGVRIAVGEGYEIRDELIFDILFNTLLPILLILPLLAVIIWTGVGRGLGPLKKVAAEIAQRSPSQLEPLTVRDTPEEIRPLAQSLNRLLERLDEALESERRFTANAAHELRTPLAGLKTQAQVALRATDEPQRMQMLAKIVDGVDRATHLVGQLLTLARLDPDAAAAQYGPVDLARTAVAVVGERAPAALEKNIGIELAEDSRGTVSGDAAALAILISNLVDNAIRYTPSGGSVEVAVTGGEDGVTLTVTDSGPGIPELERARVFERFYRAPGSGSQGCGLGLSIVQRIAELHGASIELAAPATGSGLQVKVRFPAA